MSKKRYILQIPLSEAAYLRVTKSAEEQNVPPAALGRVFVTKCINEEVVVQDVNETCALKMIEHGMDAAEARRLAPYLTGVFNT